MWGEEGVNYITWTGSWELSEGWEAHNRLARLNLRTTTRHYGKAAETNPGNRGRWRRGLGPFRTKLETEDGVVHWSPPMKQ